MDIFFLHICIIYSLSLTVGGGLQELTSTVKLIQLFMKTDRLSILVELAGLNFMIKINLNYMSPDLFENWKEGYSSSRIPQITASIRCQERTHYNLDTLIMI